MIKKISAFLLSLLLLVSLVTSASAVGLVYDETEQMTTDQLTQLHSEVIPGIHEATGIQTEIYLLTYMVEGDTLLDFGTRLYQNGDYAGQDYVSLLILVDQDAEGWALNADDPYAIIVGGSISKMMTADGVTLQKGLSAVMKEYSYPYQWDHNLSEDQSHFWQTVEAFLYELDRFTRTNQLGSFIELEYVTDDAQLLTSEQEVELNSLAQAISQQYGCGLYLMTVEDWRDYSGKEDAFNATWDIYHRRRLGFGSERNGLIVMLSMAERDCTLFVYGDHAENAFNLYGQEQLELQYLDNFKQDDYYGGYLDYLNTAREYLALESVGDPVRDNPTGLILLFMAIAWLIALAITMVLYNKMKNVKTMKHAANYISAAGLHLYNEEDTYITTTYEVREIESKSETSSSGSRSGGGGSGRSSKF